MALVLHSIDLERQLDIIPIHQLKRVVRIEIIRATCANDGKFAAAILCNTCYTTVQMDSLRRRTCAWHMHIEQQ